MYRRNHVRRSRPYALIAALSIAVFWLVFLAVAYVSLDSVVVAVWVGSFLVIVNLVTFIFFGYDKSIAGRPVYRVPESVLLWLAFSGGSPAAGLAQLLFRHKTRKRAFRLAFFSILFAQIAIVFYGYRKQLYVPLWIEVRPPFAGIL